MAAMDETHGYSIEGPDSDLVFAVMAKWRAEAEMYRALFEREQVRAEQAWEIIRDRDHAPHWAIRADDELLRAAEELGIDISPGSLAAPQ